MIDITPEQIAAAVSGDGYAAESVIRAMDERIIQLARRIDADRAEDLAQEGRLSLWLAIPRFEGDSPAQFFKYADSTLSRDMTKARRGDQREGVSRENAWLFEKALRMSGGDPMAAERLCSDSEVMGRRRMSPEMAETARHSWQGTLSLDAAIASPSCGGTEITIAGRLTYDDERQRVSEEEKAAKRAKVEAVRSTLDGLDPAYESVLSAEFGIGDYPYAIGRGDGAWDELADAAGVPRSAVESVEGAAREAFALAYLGGAQPESAEGTKTCKCCGVTKSAEAFYVRNKATGARMATCKTCKASSVAQRDAGAREAKNARNRAYRARLRQSDAA